MAKKKRASTSTITPSEALKINPKRVFRKDAKIFSDLFKLEPSVMLKNIAWEEHVTRYLQLEHCHMFHSYDSKGIKQLNSTPTGGHFHKIDITWNDEGKPSANCGPPMKFAKEKFKGRWRKVISNYCVDDSHTHEVTYKESCELYTPKLNPETVKLLAFETAKTAPIPGIV